MKKLNDIKMKPKLILILLISALLPLSVIGIFSIKLSTDALMKAAFNQLTSVRELKHAEIKKYFTKTKHDLQVLVDTVTIFQKQSFNVLEAAHDNKIVTLNRYFTNTFRNIHTLSISSNIENLLASLLELSELNSSENKGDFDTESERYRAIVATQDSYLKKYGENLGYRNILVIKADSGQVIYTTAADKDKGTNLRNGPYSNSGLAEIWRKTVAEKKDSIVDFTNYEPAGGEPMMFIGSPITSGSTVTGILVAEISVAPINEIMHERAGLGRTGEIYVVGTDLLLRTDSALHGEKFNVKQSFKDPDKYRINIEAVEMALSGKDSSDLTTGYNGTSTLSTFSSIKIKDLTWAVIGEMEAEEAYSPRDEQGKEFYKDYIDRYGFYDLYLIRSDGYCFYSAAREADYQTNFLNGKYSNYNLGTLFKRVTNSRQMGIADFAPYAPSNNAPAAFIAQPVIHPLDNEVEIVIALQLPLEGINEIMQNREGMGESGESYLIGPDKLMRSDSILDPNNRTVVASFAGTVKDNGVDTEASSSALRGESDAKIIIDYLGNPVLSAYTLLDIGEIKWGLLAEIDKTEVQKPINGLILSILVIAGVMVVLLIVLALYIAKQLSHPIIQSVNFAQKISHNDLTSRLAIKQDDEIGDLAKALNEMASSLSNIVRELNNGVGTLSSSATEMASIAEQMTQGSQTTVEKSNSVATAAEEMNSNMNSVAAAMEEASVNVGTVASATEEMSASISEIAKNASVGMESVKKAVNQSQKASSQVHELGKAAEEIETVTESIKAISDQTNLLALNATIEAARAGEAGKGFAVVANEIKELAKQTADATGDISSKLHTIQQSTGVTVDVIEEVVGMINKVDEIVSDIAAAVEQQNTATKEITENIAQASMGIQEINENVNQSSAVSSMVAQDINEVNMAAEEMSSSSLQVETSASELSKLSESLREIIARFKL